MEHSASTADKTELAQLRIALRESEARLQAAESEIAELKGRGPSPVRRSVGAVRHRLGTIKHKALHR